MDKVFVYGTLKSGEPNHGWMTEWSDGQFQLVGKGTTQEAYPLVIGTQFNIPFLLDRPGVGHKVEGEIYEVDGKMMERLDELEDHPHFYVRQERTVILDADKKPLTCWIYVIQLFREDLLDLPQLKNYSSDGSHGLKYCERYLRPDEGYTAKDDVQGTLTTL